MRKNRTMRVAALLLALTLITSCFVGGTFAKYTSSVNSQDSARVANWGFEPSAIDLTGLFDKVYNGEGDTSVSAEVDVIAPGTTGSDTFKFVYDESAGSAPEVAYTFTVDTTGSSIHDDVKNNTNIQWKLDNGSWGTWDQLITAIKKLSGSTDSSGSATYGPGSLPSAFGTADTEHTVSWQWVFETADDNNADNGSEMATQDATDTNMGNANTLANVTLKITITATQLDTYAASASGN